MFDLAVKAFDKDGDVYPIWGTCLGFEQLSYLSNNKTDPRTPCYAEDVSLKLNFTTEFDKSQVGKAMPKAVKDIFSNEKVAVNFHRYCITPTTMSKEPMKEFWTPLATNHDGNGTEFVSLMEGKKYPFYGSQFHPEKNPFEWTSKYSAIPHSKQAIEGAAFLADFFVNECRKSKHQFGSKAEEQQQLIYNYNPLYTGKAEVNYSMQQCYMFKNEGSNSGCQSTTSSIAFAWVVGLICAIFSRIN